MSGKSDFVKKTVLFEPEQLEQIDEYRATQRPIMSWQDAIRNLIDDGLEAENARASGNRNPRRVA